MKTLIIGLLLTTAFAFTFKTHHKTVLMTKTFILVHGAWQAPYAWQSVQQQLESNGQKVIVIELPGHGADKTPAAQTSIYGLLKIMQWESIFRTR